MTKDFMFPIKNVIWGVYGGAAIGCADTPRVFAYAPAAHTANAGALLHTRTRDVSWNVLGGVRYTYAPRL